jgi:hypothetical protein
MPPPITTSTPCGRLSGAAATRTASSRFCGPSHPRSLAERIAPVNTTGLSGASERATRYAVSSSVSVPWVTTTPSTSGSATSSAMRFRSAHCRATVMCGPGKRPHASGHTLATRSIPGAAARISSAESDGTAPPSRASIRIEMVPPVNSAVTRRAGARRSATAGQRPRSRARSAASSAAVLTRTARSRRSR